MYFLDEFWYKRCSLLSQCWVICFYYTLGFTSKPWARDGLTVELANFTYVVCHYWHRSDRISQHVLRCRVIDLKN
jgi:hypothetical protein